MIEVLEKNKIPIAAVAGSSMGAYVGALWCAGYNAQQLIKLAEEIHSPRQFRKLSDLAFPPSKGIFWGLKARNHLRKSIGDIYFDALQRPLIVIAADLDTHRRVIGHKGRVIDAVHASCALPGFIVPVHYQGHRCIDGGVIEPIPICSLRKHVDVDYVIAVSTIPSGREIEACSAIKTPPPKKVFYAAHSPLVSSPSIFSLRATSSTLLTNPSRPHKSAWRMMPMPTQTSSSNPFPAKGIGTTTTTTSISLRLAVRLQKKRFQKFLNSFNPSAKIKRICLMTHPKNPWWESASADEIHHRQGLILHSFIKDRVLPFTAHYRELFRKHDLCADDFKSTEDLVKLPFTDKSQFTDAKDFVIVPEMQRLKRQWSTIKKVMRSGPARARQQLEQELRPIFMTSTTGRSADPVPFFYTQHDLNRLQASGHRLMQICQSQSDYRHINAFPFAPHLAFWQAHYAGLAYNTFTLSTGGGKTIGTDGNIRIITKINPDAIIAMPTFLYHLLQGATQESARWTKLKTLVLGGEKVPLGMRRKLRELCAQVGAESVQILSTYGFTEAKVAWSECPTPEGEESAGFHIYPDMGFVEVIDPETGRRVGENQAGEIVFTQLDARGTIVLRYRTGDLIEKGISYAPCPALWTYLPALSR